MALTPTPVAFSAGTTLFTLGATSSAATTVFGSENSEVLFAPAPALVAVAVTVCPAANCWAVEKLKVALPSASVLTVVPSMKSLPSSPPAGLE